MPGVMNATEFQRRVQEIVEKTDPAKQKDAQQKELNAAKVGMGFLLLRHTLQGVEALTSLVGVNTKGLERNCMRDEIMMEAWQAVMQEQFGSVEVSPKMMFAFCLATQCTYTWKTNRKRARVAQAKGIPVEEVVLSEDDLSSDDETDSDSDKENEDPNV